jgi:hypothetical protein
VAEFARLKAQLASEDTSTAQQSIEQACADLPSAAAIDQLSESFALSAFERDVLLLCAGVEMDSGLAAQCATSGEPSGRPFVTFALALARLEQPHWSALTPVGPLRLWRLLEVKDEHALTSSRLIVDERVLHYLAGVNYLDPRLRPLLRPRAAPAALADSHARIVEAVVQALQTSEHGAVVVQLIGDDRAGQEDAAALAAARLGLQLLVLRTADIPPGLHEADALSVLWHREAALLGSAILVLVEHDDGGAATAARWVEHAGGVVFIAAPQPLPLDRPELRVTINRPDAVEQKRLWIQALGSAAALLNGALDGALDGVATQFRLSTEVILRTARTLGPSLASAPAPETALWQACRASVRGGLEALAHRVEPVATWPQLILPEPQIATLRQIAIHVRQRLKVYEEWGFAGTSARGLGIAALFSGESGTGKTMAAEVLANELRLDLYRIDLASTVSKYIGETEKNLRRLFDAAEDSGAILLFDEADALFGRRSEIKDSHDRYANIEVSYLLQRIEAYRGLAILTTNLEAALDPAFQRRLRFTVQFPFPDPAQRERIWRGVFPAATPLDNIDPVRLARLNVAGGSIRNIALHAAFLAAELRTSVGMSHLLRAARSEAAKRDRPFSEAETRGWA